MESIESTQLSEFLYNYFSKEELNTLCFKMGVDYRDFNKKLLKEYIASLLSHIQQTGREQELCRLVKKERPALFGVKTLLDNTQLEPFSRNGIMNMDRVKLFDLLVKEFSHGQLLTIDRHLLNEKAIEPYAATCIVYSREIVLAAEELGSLDQLRQLLIRHFVENKPVKQADLKKREPDVIDSPLLRALSKELTVGEFYKLIDIDPFEIGGIGYREGIEFFVRRNQQDLLIERLTKVKKQVKWNELVDDYLSKIVYPNTLVDQIYFYFDKIEFRTILFDLAINENDIIRLDYSKEAAENLLSHCSSTGPLEDLHKVLRLERPLVQWLINSSDT